MRRNLRPDDLGDLLTRPKVAILATHNRKGNILLVPVWHEWREGGFSFIVGADDVKARNLRRDPRASIQVADDAPPYRGIEVRGEAQLMEADAETLRRLAVRYLGPEMGRAYAGGTDPATQTLVRLEPGKLRAWDFADEFQAQTQ